MGEIQNQLITPCLHAPAVMTATMTMGAVCGSGRRNATERRTATAGPKSCSGPYLDPPSRSFSEGRWIATDAGMDNSRRAAHLGVSNRRMSVVSPRYGIPLRSAHIRSLSSRRESKKDA